MITSVIITILKFFFNLNLYEETAQMFRYIVISFILAAVWAQEILAKTPNYDFSQIAFVVLSQSHPRHATIGNATKSALVR